MRLPIVAAILLFSSGALAAERDITLSFVDLDIEQQNGAPHLVSVALSKDGHLQLGSHSVIPVGSGGYNAVVQITFDDGSITTILHVDQDQHSLAGKYAVFSGSAAYSGVQGQGWLRTMTGREAAASSQGVYQAHLRVTVPELAMATVQ